ncbi:MAG TPA: ChrR family anti-sigma-E factor [Rhizomicrobium sp.]|nr:ChrR family anti-sigma-E factor [Rhizomicrobium sp.]
MTIMHHPSDDVLIAYATGASDEAVSLVIATHLTLCPQCRRSVAAAEAAGGSLLSGLAPVSLGHDALSSVLTRLDDAPAAAGTETAFIASDAAMTPEPLRHYAGELGAVKWISIAPGISFRPLLKRGKMRVRLIRSAPGAGVAPHTHCGIELTQVLTGGYSDVTGHYRRGDFQTTDASIIHDPTADDDGYCINLAVTDAPLKFQNLGVGLLAKLFGF